MKTLWYSTTYIKTIFLATHLQDKMAQSWENIVWFYSGKLSKQTPESLDHKIFYGLLSLFTLTGFLYLLYLLVQFTRLLLSLFVLPGKPVRPLHPFCLPSPPSQSPIPI